MRKALFMLSVLSDADIEWLIRVGVRRTLPAGTLIIREGEPIGALFILLDGLAVVSVHQTEVARLMSGELLGEISMIDSRPPTASAVAEIETTVLTIDLAQLKKKLKEDMGFGCRFYHAVATFLADRLRSSVTRMGYGTARTLAGPELEDELDPDILDKVHLAGAKFDELLKRTLRV